ncbi:dihydrodipicolinate synthase family protein [Occallatibacter riparius]|uniref:Dihydrodipicolinate synthase family protein n=1 Tax=Occallatibacter riparius TaxID=1002689 RepID=A0A9J7BG23_9BACT|nr:dihydrodipicolinate synthase family protein [Occallatibacter riparius]UWZ81703.1 dihydrodipicolinate synthase family protein [Occallatibacter riparius]
MQWKGVMPAMTTAFDAELKVDHAFIGRHARWLRDNGCAGMVCLGSLGEAATLTFDEKISVIQTVAGAVSPQIPVVAAISALSTAEAVALAQSVSRAGAQGLMILPPYVYQGDWREMKAHVAAILAATELPAMLYNNPVAYGTDFTPEQIQELAREFPSLAAVKESSTDVRRVTAIRALTGDRLAIFVGVDDAIVEGIDAGAVGWIAGLVNAFPRESVDLFNFATEGRKQEAFELYRWFLPLLRMDTVPKFVQLIKQVQQEAGLGSARVRPPRLQLEGPELAAAKADYAQAAAHRPAVAKRSTALPR